MFNQTFKTALLRSTIMVGAAAFATPGLAQVAAGTQVAAADTPENAQEIIVTGSLIKNPNLIRSTPVIVTTADTIELKQSNVAEEVLREIPGVVPSIGSAVNNGNNGASYVDLRGLGSFRNIVLLDGNRIVPSGLLGRVDLNNIPLALVERVESLTGAASTTYGADAITGVVNFITKQDFTGIDFSVSEQISEKGDGNYLRTDLTIGGNFADDKGNAVLSVGYQEADPVYQGDRDFSVSNVDSFSGALGGSGTAVPSRFTGTRRIDPVTGLPSTQPAALGFDAAGDPIANPAVGAANPGQSQIDPATGRIIANYSPFNFNPYNIFQTPFKRFNIFAQAKYDVSDHFELYTRGLFSKNTVNTIIAPSGSFGSSLTIPLSNPYLPAITRQQFCALNVAPVTPSPVAGKAGAQTTYVPFLTPAQCTAAATATNPTDPNYRTVTTAVSRRTPEVGARVSQYNTTVFDYRVGGRGSINDHLDYDVNGAYGESENLQQIQNYVLTSRLRQAALATNTTTCLNNTNGCVPVNLFGPNGSITPAQVAFLTAESTTRVQTSLAQVHGAISGDLGFSSPAASDPVSFAVGGEYRNYKASQSSDLLSKTAGELGGAGGAQPDIKGGYDVKEAFGELVVPLAQDKPLLQSLTFEAGIRYSAYKVEAPGSPKYNTTTYKAGGSWEPTAGVKFRGNYSRAVRAPNINELFEPVTTGLTNLSTDPCAGAAPLSNANLRAVCLAQGATATQIGTITNPTAGQANITTGGNINLRPEKATTYTGGVIFQPSFVRGLAITVDYYNIKVKQAITTPLPGDIISGCFGNITAASATDPNCLAFQRNPATGNLDGDPSTTPGLNASRSNSGTLATDGIDVAVNYSGDIGFAKLGMTFIGNYTAHSKFQAQPGTLNRDCVGYYSVNCSYTGSIQPKFQWSHRTTLSFDAFDLSLLWRHIDSVEQEPDDALPANSGPAFSGTDAVTGKQVNYGKIKSFNYFDLTGRVSVMENLTFTLAVQNLLDKKPPIVGSTIGSTTFNSGNTYPSTYDALGRRYAVTGRIRF